MFRKIGFDFQKIFVDAEACLTYQYVSDYLFTILAKQTFNHKEYSYWKVKGDYELFQLTKSVVPNFSSIVVELELF